MRNMPANIVIEKNRMSTAAAWLILLEITLTDTPATVFRLVRNNENIIFEGNEYTAFNFEIDPTEQSSEGRISTTVLRVSNITRLIESNLQTLNGGAGSNVKVTVVNSELLSEDYSDQEFNFSVLETSTSSKWVEFRLGAPSPLRQRFPLNRYLALHCRWRFENIECSYARKTVAGVTLAGTDPVSIEVTGHGFSTGDQIRHADIAGITPAILTFTITKTDVDNYTLDGTDSSDYSGAYTSGGTAGFLVCGRTLEECRIRENAVQFGGFPGIRSGGVRLV